ncbi:MAG: DHH family phosphoesterase [Clostridium sp.]|nr:DHH family phosphoesterase [Clostridium sp.]MCM1397851.1 DHH family phosphoesterase [Clostridium sp.]MCM1459091.1 DHH family phosphoesterase [Bacteroides sp.]
MKLRELEQYNPITIQCHDNPDADALASGYGLYCYFRDKGKQVSLVYSGRNEISKSNLKLMVEELNIPVKYLRAGEGQELHVDGLLITVDCQYGAGNVSRIAADNVAVIDHHQIEIDNIKQSHIIPGVGSCATLVWNLLLEEGYDVDSNEEDGLGTALYYGLYTDTNQFAELNNPLDKDLRESVKFDGALINRLRNSNLTLKELEVAGVAMLRYSFNDEYGFAVIKSQPCDPNILGLISDFLLQVDCINVCVVYNEIGDGYKLSVRSCVREVNASELAAFLTEQIGSGGGHYEKAGGFISKKLYVQQHKTLHAEAYFNSRMTEYFDSFDLIYAKNYTADLKDMKQYEKKKLPIGYVNIWEVLPVGTPIIVRTLEGDVDMVVEQDLLVMIGIRGEVYPMRMEKFNRSYKMEDRAYVYESDTDMKYVPTVKVKSTGETLTLTDYARTCTPSGTVYIYAKPLLRGVKVFTAWDKEKYMLGRPGDYLAVRSDDLHDVYVVEQKIFGRTYKEVSE